MPSQSCMQGRLWCLSKYLLFITQVFLHSVFTGEWISLDSSILILQHEDCSFSQSLFGPYKIFSYSFLGSLLQNNIWVWRDCGRKSHGEFRWSKSSMTSLLTCFIKEVIKFHWHLCKLVHMEPFNSLVWTSTKTVTFWIKIKYCDFSCDSTYLYLEGT